MMINGGYGGIASMMTGLKETEIRRENLAPMTG